METHLCQQICVKPLKLHLHLGLPQMHWQRLNYSASFVQIKNIWQKAGARLKLTETEKQQAINYLFKSAKDLVVLMLTIHSFDFRRNMFFWKAYKTSERICSTLSSQIDVALQIWGKQKKVKTELLSLHTVGFWHGGAKWCETRMCSIMRAILEINFNRANERKIDSATVKSYEIISNASTSTRSSMVSK